MDTTVKTEQTAAERRAAQLALVRQKMCFLDNLTDGEVRLAHNAISMIAHTNDTCAQMILEFLRRPWLETEFDKFSNGDVDIDAMEAAFIEDGDREPLAIRLSRVYQLMLGVVDTAHEWCREIYVRRIREALAEEAAAAVVAAVNTDQSKEPGRGNEDAPAPVEASRFVDDGGRVDAGAEVPQPKG